MAQFTEIELFCLLLVVICNNSPFLKHYFTYSILVHLLNKYFGQHDVCTCLPYYVPASLRLNIAFQTKLRPICDLFNYFKGLV